MLRQRNYDNQCFKWAITAALNPKENNSERLQQYIEPSKQINWKGINFPATHKDFSKFENNNDISLNIFEIGTGKVYLWRMIGYVESEAIQKVKQDRLYFTVNFDEISDIKWLLNDNNDSWRTRK